MNEDREFEKLLRSKGFYKMGCSRQTVYNAIKELRKEGDKHGAEGTADCD